MRDDVFVRMGSFVDGSLAIIGIFGLPDSYYRYLIMYLVLLSSLYHFSSHSIFQAVITICPVFAGAALGLGVITFSSSGGRKS